MQSNREVSMGDEICICLEQMKYSLHSWFWQRIQGERLRILYEDEDILAVNKPAGVLNASGGYAL